MWIYNTLPDRIASPVFSKTAPPVILRFLCQLLFYSNFMDPAAVFYEFLQIHQLLASVFPYKAHVFSVMTGFIISGKLIYHAYGRLVQVTFRVTGHQKVTFFICNTKSKNIQFSLFFLFRYQFQKFFLIPFVCERLFFCPQDVVINFYLIHTLAPSCFVPIA